MAKVIQSTLMPTSVGVRFLPVWTFHRPISPDFIVNDTSEDTTTSYPLWKDLDTWEGDDTPEAMETIAQGIVARHQIKGDPSAHMVEENMTNHPPLPDVDLWRVPVKVRNPLMLFANTS